MAITAIRTRRLVACALMTVFPIVSVHAACMGMQVHAHRGAPDHVENSLAAISAAYAGAWDGVEIDMQRLRDGRWVLHHDVLTGRTVGGVGISPVLKLASSDWRAASLIGKGEGGPPAFLDDAIRVAAARSDKTFNAELKVVYTACEPIAALIKEMKRSLAHGNWMITSAFPQALQCARRADPGGYLGLIVFDPRHAEAAGSNRISRYVAKRAGAPQLTRQWLSNLVANVGAPVGVHIDASTLAANPNLLQDAAALSVRVFVYAVDGDIALAKQLLITQQREGYLPSGVIIDGDPTKFCRAVGS